MTANLWKLWYSVYQTGNSKLLENEDIHIFVSTAHISKSAWAFLQLIRNWEHKPESNCVSIYTSKLRKTKTEIYTVANQHPLILLLVGPFQTLGWDAQFSFSGDACRIAKAACGCKIVQTKDYLQEAIWMRWSLWRSFVLWMQIIPLCLLPGSKERGPFPFYLLD